MTYEEIADRVKQEVEVEIGATIKIRKYSKSPWSGRAWFKLFEIIVPLPTTPIRLSTYLHELGHLTNLARIQKKSCLREFYAEQFSINQLKRFGVKRNRKMIRHTNWYMAYSLAQALNRKLKDIPPELKKYKKLLYKCPNGWRTK